MEMFVKSEYQRNGYGSMLIEKVKNYVIEKSLLYVGSKNSFLHL